jgi:transcription initiation factor TFIID subunit 2
MEHNDEDAELLKRTVAEVERYKSMDRLIQSPHNIVTIAALEVRIIVQIFIIYLLYFRPVFPSSQPREPCSQPSSNILSFNQVSRCPSMKKMGLNAESREGNYTQVRIAAFDGLFLTKWYTPPIMRYILAVVAKDPSRVIRRHVARNACQSLAILASMGDMKNSAKESESLLIEEDGTAPEKAREAKKSDVDIMIKILRKDKEVGKNDALRDLLIPIAL